MEYYSLLKSFADKLPKFPDGRINYTGCNEAPVVTVFVFCQDKMLLLRRSQKVTNYNGKWNTVAGFLDAPRVLLQDQILTEIREELGQNKENIVGLKIGESFTLFDPEIGKTWHIFPAKVEIKSPQINLDFEHTEFVWIEPEELDKFDHVYGLEKTLVKVS